MKLWLTHLFHLRPIEWSQVPAVWSFLKAHWVGCWRVCWSRHSADSFSIDASRTAVEHQVYPWLVLDESRHWAELFWRKTCLNEITEGPPGSAERTTEAGPSPVSAALCSVTHWFRRPKYWSWEYLLQITGWQTRQGKVKVVLSVNHHWVKSFQWKIVSYPYKSTLVYSSIHLWSAAAGVRSGSPVENFSIIWLWHSTVGKMHHLLLLWLSICQALVLTLNIQHQVSIQTHLLLHWIILTFHRCEIKCTCAFMSFTVFPDAVLCL